MTGLPRSIIKKYGVSKKAWAVYRGSTSKKKTRHHYRSVNVMAKRRKHGYSKSKGGFGGMSASDAILFGVGYGVIRQPINDGIKKLTGNLALNLSDEIVLGAVHYFGAKQNWFGMRKLFTAGLVVEASRLGSNVSLGGLNLFGNTTSETTL